MSLQVASVSKAALLAEPLSFVEEISHRVINEYTEAICLLHIAAAGPADTPARETLMAVADRLRAQAEAHRALQAPNAEGLIDLADHLSRVCACLSKAPLLENGVWLTIQTEEIWLDAARCWRVGLIVAELVRNAARHGLAGGPGAIRVVISEHAEHIACSVLDTGQRPPEKRPGRGQRLVQALAAELEGSIEWRFVRAGCRARLQFPTTRATDGLAPAWKPCAGRRLAEAG